MSGGCPRATATPVVPGGFDVMTETLRPAPCGSLIQPRWPQPLDGLP